MIYRVLAEVVPIVHFCFVLFVVLGGLLVLRWPSVLWLHLPAFIWGVLVQCFLWACPLTPLENWFRRSGGRSTYAGGFVDHYISSILYANVSRRFQAALGLLLIALNVVIYLFVLIRRRRRIEYNQITTTAAE